MIYVKTTTKNKTKTSDETYSKNSIPFCIPAILFLFQCCSYYWWRDYLSFDSCNFMNQITQEVIIETTNVVDLENDFDVQIFPNPNQGRFNLKIENIKQQEFKIDVLDLYGKEWFFFTKKISEGITLEKIEIDFLPKGIYFIKIKNDSRLIVKRVVVQ